MRYFSNISSDKQTFIKSLILGVVSSVAMIAVLLCVVTVILLSVSLLPYEYLSYIMLVIDAIGVLFGGYIAARINKSQGLILGLLNGFIVFVAFLICGFSTTSDNITLITALKAIVILLFSAFGGIKGVNVKEKIRIK
ncbi:MAG: TIGR04086 family membrane protein [Ruminococcaceae bacterium]|nr:TIGR04086 family membrane protein [Oscillospiraceae bacterium]